MTQIAAKTRLMDLCAAAIRNGDVHESIQPAMNVWRIRQFMKVISMSVKSAACIAVISVWKRMNVNLRKAQIKLNKPI